LFKLPAAASAERLKLQNNFYGVIVQTQPADKRHSGIWSNKCTAQLTEKQHAASDTLIIDEMISKVTTNQ